MNKSSYHILRVGLAVTFLWVGVLIVKNPLGRGSFLQPWAAGLLPGSVYAAMIATAVLDLAIGFLLLIDSWTWLASLVAAFHLIVVLVVAGIGDVTVRDVGLFAASLALMVDSMPQSIASKLKFRRG